MNIYEEWLNNKCENNDSDIVLLRTNNKFVCFGNDARLLSEYLLLEMDVYFDSVSGCNLNVLFLNEEQYEIAW